ncbi:MAG: ABC transporter permease subunit [Deltaproteobacteria bacterium]|nr:ABC transporter permease subunit [Deltaproteobacteria bacterium]MBW1944599.1 ABC transporter permease subunit [Deltaproteobacteria bacterium]MBW2207641.1 ABC transporter permease subunit [Deltaproteobacteria bacterium]
MTSISFLRRTAYQAIFVLIVLGIWAFFIREQATEMTMPPPWEVGRVFYNFIVSGELLFKLYHTVLAIVIGLVASILIAMVMTSAALLFTRAAYVVEVLTTIMHPMPSVAMIPLVIVWVGIGFSGVVALTINSCLWPILLNSYTGFRAVHVTYMEVGRNVGLRKFKLILHVMIPSALPYLLAGLKVAWARSWRTVVAAEMVFGTTSASEGIGWFIFEALQYVNFSQILSGVLVIILFGIVMERGVFETIEKKTVIRWGMSK